MFAGDRIVARQDNIFSESQWARTVYEIVTMLCEKNLVSGDPLKIQIQRVNRKPVCPCRRSYGSNVLDMSQLTWASEHGQIWFSGPIESLNIVLDKGSIRGYLVATPKNVTITISVNKLNLDDWRKAARHLRNASEQLGLQISFKEVANSYVVELIFSEHLPLSVQNVSLFLKKVGKLIKLIRPKEAYRIGF